MRPGFDLGDWFGEQELERCGECGATRVVRTPGGGYLLCLDCGLFDRDGKRIGNLKCADEGDGGPEAVRDP
jgi:hypothetical protein